MWGQRLGSFEIRLAMAISPMPRNAHKMQKTYPQGNISHPPQIKVGRPALQLGLSGGEQGHRIYINPNLLRYL